MLNLDSVPLMAVLSAISQMTKKGITATFKPTMATAPAMPSFSLDFATCSTLGIQSFSGPPVTGDYYSWNPALLT